MSMKLPSTGEGRPVSDVMTSNPTFVEATDPVRVAAERMREADVGALPVRGADGRFCGIVTDRDLTVRITAEGRPAETPVADVMTRDLVVCAEDEDVAEVGRIMRERRVRRVAVVRRDEHDRDHPRELAGMVSLGDVARHVPSGGVAGQTLERVSARR
jgi:CBS domain-containing protein